MQSYQRFQHIGHTIFNASGTNGSRSLSQVKAGTHATPAPNRAHTGSHGETRGVSGGGAITTLGPFCAVRKPCAAGYQNGILCRFWALVRALPENAESLRNSDALMRVAVTRRRGPAGLRDPVAVSLHRGTPRFWSTVITECRERHTSFLCAELLCQLCLCLPPLCCTL